MPNKQVVKTVAAVKPTKISDLSLIKEFEGLRLQAYMPTPQDRWTIGYGHTKTAHKGMVIDNAKAESLLRQDVSWVEDCVNGTVTVPLTQNQFDALGSLIYNIGAGAFSKSTLLRVLNTKDYQGAADQFLRWDKQAGKTLAGLTRRRKAERELFLK